MAQLSLLDLPLEVLARVLGALPVADLVRVRAVCTCVAAAVRLLRDADRVHVFRCGADDVRSVPQLRFTCAPDYGGACSSPTPMLCTCGAPVWTPEKVRCLVQMQTPSAGTGPATGTESTAPATGTGSTAPATGTGPAEPTTRTGPAEPAAGTGSAEPAAGTGSTAPATGTGSLAPATGTGSPEPAAGTGSYAARHDQRYPPARWKLLAPLRADALEVARECAKVDLRLFVPYGMDRNNGGPDEFVGWVPFVWYLPDTAWRPTTPGGLRNLVQAALDHDVRRAPGWAGALDALVGRLGSLDAACRLYAEYDREDEDEDEDRVDRWQAAWRDGWKVPTSTTTGQADHGHNWDSQEYDEGFGNDDLAAALDCFSADAQEAARVHDLSGWTRWEFAARHFAAKWRWALGHGTAPEFRHRRLPEWTRPFAELSDAGVTEYLDGNVHAVDALHAFMEKRCVVSAVTERDGQVRDGHVWVGVAGLTPSGHVVGALSGKTL